MMKDDVKPPIRVYKSVSIRLPEGLMAAVHALATSNERSFNGQVVWILRSYLKSLEVPNDNRRG
jgi:hypothetical protein